MASKSRYTVDNYNLNEEVYIFSEIWFLSFLRSRDSRKLTTNIKGQKSFPKLFVFPPKINSITEFVILRIAGTENYADIITRLICETFAKLSLPPPLWDRWAEEKEIVARPTGTPERVAVASDSLVWTPRSRSVTRDTLWRGGVDWVTFGDATGLNRSLLNSAPCAVYHISHDKLLLSGERTQTCYMIFVNKDAWAANFRCSKTKRLR